MKFETGSIHQIHQRLVADGFKISEYTLRIWVKQGILPAEEKPTFATATFSAFCMAIQMMKSSRTLKPVFGE